MGTIGEIILALVICSVMFGLIYASIEYFCKRDFNKLEVGDQYLIVSRRNPRLYVYLTVTDLDSNKGTVSYNLRKDKSDTKCYGEDTVSYKHFFLTTLFSNNSTYVEYLGNIITLKNH